MSLNQLTPSFSCGDLVARNSNSPRYAEIESEDGFINLLLILEVKAHSETMTNHYYSCYDFHDHKKKFILEKSLSLAEPEY